MTNDAPDTVSRWAQRRWAARAIRAVVLVAPFGLSAVSGSSFAWGSAVAVAALDEARLDDRDVARVAAASVKTFNLALECLDDTRDI